MIVARWYVNARFGRKQDLISELKAWWCTIGKEIGQTDYSILTGSIGAAESLITVDVRSGSDGTSSAVGRPRSARRPCKVLSQDRTPAREWLDPVGGVSARRLRSGLIEIKPERRIP